MNLVGQFSANRFSLRFVFCELTFQKNGTAARTGRESHEFNANRREDAICANLAKRESAKRWCANRLPTKGMNFFAKQTNNLPKEKSKGIRLANLGETQAPDCTLFFHKRLACIAQWQSISRRLPSLRHRTVIPIAVRILLPLNNFSAPKSYDVCGLRLSLPSRNPEIASD